MLHESDINDPTVHVDLDRLADYSKDHLISWLKFCGDSLQGIKSIKDARVRTLHYLNNHLENKIVDPSPDQKWLNQKAARLGITLCKRHTASLPDVPKML